MTRTVWLVIDDEPHDDGETPDNGVVIAGAMTEADARDQAEREGLDPFRNVIALEALNPGERYPKVMRSKAELAHEEASNGE